MNKLINFFLKHLLISLTAIGLLSTLIVLYKKYKEIESLRNKNSYLEIKLSNLENENNDLEIKLDDCKAKNNNFNRNLGNQLNFNSKFQNNKIKVKKYIFKPIITPIN